MAKKWAARLALLAACACPYVFWGMYGDAALGSMAGYLPLLAWLALLCWAAVRRRDIPVALAGTLLSCLVSYGFTARCQLEKWSWYFGTCIHNR